VRLQGSLYPECAVHLACQLIAGKLVRKNRPTQVTGFVVDLAGKCAEGLHMNWAKVPGEPARTGLQGSAGPRI
jgi:hypothetical protein